MRTMTQREYNRATKEEQEEYFPYVNIKDLEELSDEVDALRVIVDALSAP